jgi:putative transcriptional regulator
MNKLKAVLKQQGRSQVWLAETLELSAGTIYNWCNKPELYPSKMSLMAIAEVLNVDIKSLENED